MTGTAFEAVVRRIRARAAERGELVQLELELQDDLPGLEERSLPFFGARSATCSVSTTASNSPNGESGR